MMTSRWHKKKKRKEKERKKVGWGGEEASLRKEVEGSS